MLVDLINAVFFDYSAVLIMVLLIAMTVWYNYEEHKEEQARERYRRQHPEE